MFTKKKIIFESALGKKSEDFLGMLKPEPAKKIIPEWYKKMANYHEGAFNKPTIKKCVPILDALSMGYIVRLAWDVYVHKTKNDKGETLLEVDVGRDLNPLLQKYSLNISEHNHFQIPKDSYHSNEYEGVLKFASPWVIKTPPGYSCLFISPMNHRNNEFRIFEGVVDTDTHTLPINFPFAIKHFKEGQKIIRGGTPIVQIIPFKRESWQVDLQYKNRDRKEPLHGSATMKFFGLGSMIDAYKKISWNKKNFD
jgi:hypothetical protein